MKKIAILLESRTRDYEVGEFIKGNLLEVLGDTVEVQAYFLSDMTSSALLSADLILVNSHFILLCR